MQGRESMATEDGLFTILATVTPREKRAYISTAVAITKNITAFHLFSRGYVFSHVQFH